MATTNELTTLVCLFHHQDQARAAVNDLLEAGIPQTSISGTDRSASADEGTGYLAELGIPERDREHLLDGLRAGGSLVAVTATSDHVDAVEKIFGNHRAKKIDETEIAASEPLAAAPVALAAQATDATIPIVEEELVVGKRTVDRGGVRVFRRVVEIPVEESINLREEHVSVQRHAVDRPVTSADVALQGDQVIELTETAEEAVVGKSARVVEEVVVGKDATERTQHLTDTVRRTEVEVEEVAPTSETRQPTRSL